MEERADEEQQAVQQIQVAEGEYYMDVDRLQEMGINATDIKKLKQAGLNTIASLVMQTRKVGSGAPPPATSLCGWHCALNERLVSPDRP